MEKLHFTLGDDAGLLLSQRLFLMVRTLLKMMIKTWMVGYPCMAG